MADHTLEEMREQALRAARYFGTGLEKHKQGWTGVLLDGVVFIAARGERADALVGVIEEEGLFGSDVHLDRPGGQQQETVITRPDVVLVPLYHAPPPEHATKTGHVHLHTLATVELGRRTRQSGECLCSKKHGSDERTVHGESDMCAECVKIAADNGIAWSLT